MGAQTIGASDSRVVHLSVDGSIQTIPTRAATVGDLLERLNIEVREQDKIEPSLGTEILEDNVNVKVTHAKPVTIIDEGKKITALVAEDKPQEAVRKAGLDVYPEDKMDVDISTEFLRDGIIGQKIVIDRATPVNLNLYGSPVVLRSHAETVGDVLAEKGIKTLEGDTVSPKPDTKIDKQTQIFVIRFGKQIINSEQVIEPPVERQEDPGADLAKIVVKDPGAPGKKIVTFEVELQNGKEASRREIQSVIAQPPKKKVIVVGTKKAPGFSGSFEAALARLRSCEGSYTSNTGNGYYGAYQFDVQTWGNFGGYPNAAAAPPMVQDQKAWETYQRRGWQPWPSCKIKMGLQDVYR